MKKHFPMSRALGSYLFTIGAILAACSPSSPGTNGQPCYANDTCNEGLVCKDRQCVSGHSGSGGGTGAGAAGGSGSGAAGGSGSGAAGGTGSSATSSTGGGDAGGIGGGTTSSSTAGAGGSTTGDHAPKFLSFGTNVMTITEGETVTFSAVLTDPDGVDDLIGGSLIDDGGGTYGAFATSGQEGSYQISVTWAQVNQVQAIQFAYGGGAERTFHARFFDQGGNSVEKMVTISLSCEGLAACDGTCVDTTQDDQNCGACGKTCPSSTGCFKSKCGVLSACLPAASSCSAACASIGQVCADKCGGNLAYTSNTTCSGTAPYKPACGTSLSAINVKSERCCCF